LQRVVVVAAVAAEGVGGEASDQSGILGPPCVLAAAAAVEKMVDDRRNDCSTVGCTSSNLLHQGRRTHCGLEEAYFHTAPVASLAVATVLVATVGGSTVAAVAAVVVVVAAAAAAVVVGIVEHVLATYLDTIQLPGALERRLRAAMNLFVTGHCSGPAAAA